MNKPISFSGYKRFITCPKYYYYHDIKGEKSDIVSSALVFGTAVDLALNHLLEFRNEPEALGLSKDIAKMHIINTKIDMYFTADYDSDLGLDLLQLYLDEKSYKGDPNELMTELLNNQNKLSDNESYILNKVVKHCLIQKVDIILNSYFTKVLPIIGSVETVQKEVTTADGSKRGIIDTIIILKDGKRVIFDNKTSSRPYEKDSVLKSPQLALYASMVNADHAGFIVMNKQITKNRKKVCSKCGYDGSGTKYRTCHNIINKKKCASEWDETIDPYSFIQIHIDKIPQINKNLINEAMDDTIKCIKNGIFPRNLNNCFNTYGQPCPYVKKCWECK
jgi:hypothetical protein